MRRGRNCGLCSPRVSKTRLLHRVEDSEWQAGLEGQRVAWSSSERNVIAAVEDYLERCADGKWTWRLRSA